MNPQQQTLKIDMSGTKGITGHGYGDIYQTVSTPQRRHTITDGEMAQGTYNPFKRFGFMSPSTNTIRSFVSDQSGGLFNSGVFTCTQLDQIGSADLSGNPTGYFADATTIWATHNNTQTIIYQDHVISGATNRDMDIYQINGVRFLMGLYLISGGSACRVWSKNISSGGTYSNNFIGSGGSITNTFDLSSAATKLVVADNGFMYIMDANAVHQVDGTILGGGSAGTITANVLLFPPYIKITDAIDYRGNLYMCTQNYSSNGAFTNFQNPVGVYIWNRVTTTASIQDFIPLTGAQTIKKIWVTPDGKIRVIVICSNSLTQIREFDGTNFKTIYEMNALAYPPFFDCATVLESGLWWVSSDGIMYVYGHATYDNSLNSDYGISEDVLFQVGNFQSYISAGSGGAIGAILYMSGPNDAPSGVPSGNRLDPEAFFISYFPTGGSLQLAGKWYPHADTFSGVILGTDPGPVYTGVYYLPVYSASNWLEITCLPTTASDSSVIATLNIYFNHSTTPQGSGFPITRMKANSGNIYIPITKKGIFAIQLSLTFSSGQSIGANDFCPSLATLVFTPVTKRI